MVKVKERQRIKRSFVFALLAVVFVILSGIGTVEKQPPVAYGASDNVASPEAGSAPASGHEGAGFDIVLLMDCSGSMKKTDPQNYRMDAARLFISLLGGEDRIGIVRFGESAQLLISLTQNSQQNRERLFATVDKITSRDFSTNITDGVQKGFDELKSSQNRNRILILMSDGKLVLGSEEKDAEAHSKLSHLLPELSRENIKLYTVAFTEESDRALLENMARETGGFFRFARTDEDVQVMFTSIFEKLKAPDAIPFDGETFTIDKEIQEATVLVTKKAGTSITLTGPSGDHHTAARHAAAMQWYASRAFDMITMGGPAVGVWRVQFSANRGNKVFVITNLRLRSSFDKSFVTRGDTVKLDAWLEKEGGFVTEKTLLDNVSFYAIVTGPDGKTSRTDFVGSGKILAGARREGVYGAEFQAGAVGDYVVTVAAESKTFKRNRVLRFNAIDPPAPAPAPQTAPPEHGSWTTVLLQFGLINVALLSVSAVGYFIRRTIMKKQPHQRREQSDDNSD